MGYITTPVSSPQDGECLQWSEPRKMTPCRWGETLLCAAGTVASCCATQAPTPGTDPDSPTFYRKWEQGRISEVRSSGVSSLDDMSHLHLTYEGGHTNRGCIL